MNSGGALPDQVDVVVVGAGFGGVYAVHRLRSLGLSVIGFEAGGDIGGTWYWNRYPGARCDIESLQYSYSFSEEIQQEWVWSERYAPQPEILRYIHFVADKCGVRPHIRLKTKVTSMVYDEADKLWTVSTEAGDTVRARFCVMSTGCLSVPRAPEVNGTDTFEGRILHTARWPSGDVGFAGERVAMIGTGASGVQLLPHLAKQADHVTVFQRTPNFSVPARNGKLDEAYQSDWKSRYRENRIAALKLPAGILHDMNTVTAMELNDEERKAEYERWWARGGTNFMRVFPDLLKDIEANDTAADFVRDKIRSTVKDQALAEKLLPFSHPIGTKRICVDTHYFETYNNGNIDIVDIKEKAIKSITPTGIETSDQHIAFDTIIFATGFDAMTGALLKIDIRGRDGIMIKDKWSAGPRTYLGLGIAGFPNLFLITGPGSPSVLSNMVLAIEHHVEWVSDCIRSTLDSGLKEVEATEEAEADWVAHVNDLASQTLYLRAASWYLGANVPGKPRVFMPYVGGVVKYREIAADVASHDYRGFNRI